PLPRPVEVLELPAPAHLVARRQLHGLGESGLGFTYKAALVAAPDVRADGDLTLVLAPGDDRRSVRDPYVCELGQWHASALAHRDQDGADRRRVGTRLRREAHHDVEAPVALEDRGDRAAAERQVDDVLHVADVDAVARHLIAIHRDAKLRLVGFLLDRRVGR